MGLPFEIICIDDFSDECFRKSNRTIANLPSVSYEELRENTGRSAIRNLLASKAQYEYFLFLDCDCSIPQHDFLERYLENASHDSVLVGGRIYHDKRPQPDQVLHWKVGRIREQKLNSGFQSNNFLIHADTINEFSFDEQIRGYGHEDTLFGYLLEKKGYHILHIENPVIHEDLQSAEEFISKQRNAIRNLIFLNHKYPDVETRLTRICRSLNRLRLSHLVVHVFKSMEDLLHGSLTGNCPSVIMLDLYKVGYYLSVKNEKETII